MGLVIIGCRAIGGVAGPRQRVSFDRSGSPPRSEFAFHRLHQPFVAEVAVYFRPRLKWQTVLNLRSEDPLQCSYHLLRRLFVAHPPISAISRIAPRRMNGTTFPPGAAIAASTCAGHTGHRGFDSTAEISCASSITASACRLRAAHSRVPT